MFLLIVAVLFGSFVSKAQACAKGNREAFCRKNPGSCVDQACQKLNQHFGIYCSDNFVRNKVYDKLNNCYDFDTCFRDFKDVYPHTPANCRSRTALCLPYACSYVNAGRRSYNCDRMNDRNRITDILKNCYMPIDKCLNTLR